ncbi:MAG TPA: glycosyltransferase [Candidatus Acidoferrales bacterium]|nr:glycosyltransferase [Candidatus Acidoferrales bacterium]
MKLSLSMIVKNEARFLPGCLESVRDLVDEIVIVDTGSTDETKSIAGNFGAKVFDFEWKNDFSLARNESMRRTTGDWVLYLDADERIEKCHHEKIRKLISSGGGDALLLNLKSKIGVKEDSQYHLVSYPRLFRKMKGVAFTGKVHEQINNSLLAARARIVQTDVTIIHLGYAQDEDVIREKAKRNYLLLLEQIERRENYGYALYQLGQTEMVLGDVEKGIAHLYEAIAAGGFGKPVEASIYGIIAEKKFNQGDTEGALEACDKSLAAAPSQSFALIMKGDIYLKYGRYRESVDSFMRALEEYRSSVLLGKAATAIEPVFDIDVLYSKIAAASSLGGDLEAAKKYYGLAAETKGKPEKVARYFEFLVKNKMWDDAVEASKRFGDYENEGWYLRIVSSACIDTGNFLEAARLLEKIADHDAVSLSSLANCKMKVGDFEGAECAFRSAMNLGYDDMQGLELFGLIQFKLGKFSDAAETLGRIVEANPENAKARKFVQAARERIRNLAAV